MFEYIKKQLQEQQNVVDNQTTPDNTETVLEYAHLFQELDDLTMSGNDNSDNRFGERGLSIEIPLEDDIELDTIEMSLSDGRVTDIPMDATVQESNYLGMKTFEDFYQEADTHLTQFPRESFEAYHARKIAYASKQMDAYKEHIIQEGLFGFDKIPIDDRRIPYHITADFGPMKGNNGQRYIVKLKLLYEVDKKNRILKKQLDTISHMQAFEMFEVLGKQLPDILRKHCPDKMENVDNVWDVCTPVKGLVPMDPPDKYKMLVCFDVDFLNDPFYIALVNDINPSKNKGVNNVKGLSENGKGDIRVENKGVAERMEAVSKTKKEIIKESYEMRRPSRFGNSYYQEAIDFGGADTSSEVPPSPDAGVAPTEPTIDGGGVPTTDVDPTTVSTDDMGVAPTEGEKTAVPVDTNNVSDQIAEKVSEETNQDNNMDFNAATDIPLDGDPGSVDVGATDTDLNGITGDPTASVDQQLTDLDNSGNTDMELEPTAEIDVENMTIDELLVQGSEKLKGMTIQQLKDFLSTADADAIQEAFILTPKNINKEIDIHLRKSLGILNDNEMELNELVTAFKKEGKKLNRVLGKASKMKKAYTDQEREDITKLNKCLVDLMTTLKSSNDASYVTTVKRLIQAFTSLSKVVAKIVEGRSGGNKETPDTNKKDGE